MFGGMRQGSSHPRGEPMSFDMDGGWSGQPGSGPGRLPGGLQTTHIVAVVVALILSATVLMAVLLYRHDPAPAPAPAPSSAGYNAYENQQKLAVACMEGGGTWTNVGLTGYCTH